jgi:predicted PhzF superfamily epimerase YddE/YHI9
VCGWLLADSGDRPSSYDFSIRFFGPWAGIDEDPVTGSAFSVAAPWFASAAVGHAPGLKLQMCARQVSPRGGDVWLDLGWEPGRVIVEGQAVMAVKQALRLDEL